MNKLKKIADQFLLPGKIVSIQPYGNGNINETFLVHLAGESPVKCIMQRINTEVFPRPELIMENIRLLSNHCRQMLQQEDTLTSDWQIMELYSTENGTDFLISDSSYWRMVNFIDQAESHEKIKSHKHAYEIGRGLGKFHRLLSSLLPHKLHDTLPGFHQTPEYLKNYDKQTKITDETVAEVEFCRKFIDQRRTLAPVLEKAKRHLPLRIIHGDPKINNIMIDKLSGRVVSLIDLDTVKPGLIHYDIGDCLRSCCNPLGENNDDPEKIFFDLAICRIILQGYFAEAEKFITLPEYDFIYQAINLIPFELGLRFFSDFLAGNIYFKTSDANQNLSRALGQFYLTRSIEKQEKQIRKIISALRLRGCKKKQEIES